MAWESRGFVSLYAFFTDGYEKRMYRNFDTPSSEYGGDLLSRFRSTIGAPELNCPVRNGKGWSLRAVAASMGKERMDGKDRRGSLKLQESVRAISSARLRASPPVHLRPIDVIVSDGPVKSNLAAGFALRCVQRLSDPDVDTRRCAWRHNRQTRGRSGTVLSY